MPTSFYLPEYLMIDILVRLPIKSLLRFRCVSKPWHDFIDSREFVKEHLARSTTNKKSRKIVFGVAQLDHPRNEEGLESCKLFTSKYDSPKNFEVNMEELHLPIGNLRHNSEVVGACNGLLCVWNIGHGLVLFNPWTRTHYMVPEVAEVKVVLPSVNYGFGYDDVNDDYKVISVVFKHSVHEGWMSKVHIFSLKSNSWRRSTEKMMNYSFITLSSSVLVNSALHWFIRGREKLGFVHSILAIDLSSEKCRFVALPELPNEEIPLTLVTNLDGCLSVIGRPAIASPHNSRQCVIWTMNDYGVKGSWTKVTSVQVSLEYGWEPIAFSEDEKQLMYYQINYNGTTREKELILNKYQEKWSRKIAIPGSGSRTLITGVTFYVPSLVQLRCGGLNRSTKERRK